MRSIFITVATLTALASLSAHASNVKVAAANYTYACGYYSESYTDFVIEYTNESLEWGSAVEIILGLEGRTVTGGGSDVREVRYEWQNEDSRAMVPSAPWTWRTSMTAMMHQRSSPSFHDGINFVFKITHADGTVAYDNGTNSPWGFYVATVLYGSQCIDSRDDPRPEARELPVTTVHRW